MKTNLLTCILLIATCFVSQNISAYDFSTIILSCTDHGTVVINNNQEFTNDIGEVDINNGAENTFVFKPNANYQLAKVLINGEDVTSSVKNNQLTTMIPTGSKMNVVFSQMTGDMNGDGTVDISDVVKLVNIILGGSTGEEPAPTYYWYAGQIEPTSQPSVSAQDSGTFTNNNWHPINVNNTYTFSNPIYNSVSNPITGDSNTYWYVALPADKSYGIYDSVDRNEVTNGNWTKESSTITINNVSYNVYKSVGTYRNFNVWWIH